MRAALGHDTRPLVRPVPHRARSDGATAASLPRLSCWWEVAAVASLTVMALAVRLPSYQDVPAFTDEIKSLNVAADALQNGAVPLTDFSPYIGGLWVSLLAAVLALTDGGLAVPRTLVLVFGVATVPATWALGRAWGGPIGGIVAAGLLASSAIHALVNSHIAWANSITPAFATPAVLTLYRAVALADSRTSMASQRRAVALLLGASGLCWGLAFQTHPSILAPLLGALAFGLWQGRHLLRTPGPYLALVAFLAVNLNLVLYNATSGLGSLDAALDKAGEYGEHAALSPALYVERLQRLGTGLFEVAGGVVEAPGQPEQAPLELAEWAAVLLSTAGLVWQWRRGNPLPVLMVATTALVLPLLNGKYEPIPNGRYLAPLLPVLFAAEGSLIAAATHRVAAASWRPAVRFAAVGALVALMVAQMGTSVATGETYRHELPSQGWTNDVIFETLRQVNAVRAPDESVVLDRTLQLHLPGWGGGTPAMALQAGLDLAHIPNQLASLHRDDLLKPRYRCQDLLIVLAPRDPSAVQEIVGRLGLQAVPAASSPGASSGGYPLFRLARLPDLADTPECAPDAPGLSGTS